MREICHHVLLTDPSQPMEQAVYNYVEDVVDGDVVGVEAWTNGDVRVWVRE